MPGRDLCLVVARLLLLPALEQDHHQQESPYKDHHLRHNPPWNIIAIPQDQYYSKKPP